MENEKGIIARFVIGRRFCHLFSNSHYGFLFSGQGEIVQGLARSIITDYMFLSSANRGDSLDKGIDNEDKQTNDFLILVCLSGSLNSYSIFMDFKIS